MKLGWDWVSPTGALLAIIVMHSPNFMIFKKMRIMATQNISASDCLGNGYPIVLAATIVLFTLTIFLGKSIWVKRIAGYISGMLIVGILYFSASALTNCILDKTNYSRMSIGLGMWLAIICYATVVIKVNESERNALVRFSTTISPLCLIAFLVLSGKLNNLGIMMEYHTYQTSFHDALIRHASISLAVIITGIVIGLPLGYLANRSKRWEHGIVPFINVIETLPAISLITIVMIPLSILANKYHFLGQLGISGFGIAAPFVALVFYAIFPIIHNTHAAFKTIKSEYIEVGKSLGMNPRQVFFKVKLPLALPVILTGIRVSIVYSISGTTLAAFIGGGGLGTFILQNDSMDFVLLGTLPIIGMTFATDSALIILINKLSNKKVLV